MVRLKQEIIGELKKSMKLQKALEYMELSKSSYFYSSHVRSTKVREYPLDAELEEVLKKLHEYELTLGYEKLTVHTSKI